MPAIALLIREFPQHTALSLAAAAAPASSLVCYSVRPEIAQVVGLIVTVLEKSRSYTRPRRGIEAVENARVCGIAVPVGRVTDAPADAEVAPADSIAAVEGVVLACARFAVVVADVV